MASAIPVGTKLLQMPSAKSRSVGRLASKMILGAATATVAKPMPSITRLASSRPADVAKAPMSAPITMVSRPPVTIARAPVRLPSIPAITAKPAPAAKKIEAIQPAVTLSSPRSAPIMPSAGGTLPTVSPTITPAITASATTSQRVAGLFAASELTLKSFSCESRETVEKSENAG